MQEPIVRMQQTVSVIFACRTWTGPAWSPAQSISSVLISIQSLMTENPYHNEPGFEQVQSTKRYRYMRVLCRHQSTTPCHSVSQERHPGDSKNYNECIRHETMRVAVCDMLEGKVLCPEALLWDPYFYFSSFYFPLSLAFHLCFLAVN